MRIVAVADTHTFEKDLGALPEGDVFIHAGDLLRGGTLEELAGVAQWIEKLDYRHKIVIAGNHDGCFVPVGDRDANLHQRAEAVRLLGSAIYLQDSGITLDGIQFWGSPWQPAYNDWFFNLPRGAPLAEKWALIPDRVDVLVTHGPPQGFGDSGPTFSRTGCADLLARVKVAKPRLHMFGHIHQDGGFWRTPDTCFANVTTWECERPPTVIDIDVATKEVTEVTVPPPRR